MNIAIVVWNLDIAGGTQRQALELARYLVRNDNKVTVYTTVFNKEKCYPEITDGLFIKSLDNSSDSKGNKESFFYKLFGGIVEDRAVTKKIEKLIEIMDKDHEIINCHDYIVNKLAYFYKKKKSKAKFVWMLNDIPVVFLAKERASWGIKEYELKNKSYSLKKRISFLRNWFLNQYFGYKERLYAKKFEGISVLDNRNKGLVRKYLKRDSMIIRSGLDLKAFSFKPKTTNKQEFIIMGASILFPYRRFEDTIEAIKILKDKGYCVRFNLIGNDIYDKDYSEKLKNLVEKLKLKKEVNFLGEVSDAELVNNYHNSDVFVFVNHYQTWGLVVFEAMASGVPTIVSTSVGASEILTDNENSLIVPPKRPDKIAEKIEILIKDEKLRQKLISNGRSFVERNITWNIYGRNMLDIFKEVIS